MIRQKREHVTVPPDGGRPEDQPKWRQDFPIDWPQDNYVSRRDFTKFMVLTSLAFTFGQFWIMGRNFLRKQRGEPSIQPVASVDQVPIGGSLSFVYPEAHDTCVLVRTGPETFVAYNQKCTHLACAVMPQFDQGRLYCPCHVGSFDLVTGSPTAGPPRRPLPRINLEVRGGTVYATGVEVKTV
ncbi:MAG TPA: Rieske (2Fe-2S) protein [Pyrinomonadaceae bacterium]|nr:Rieske (2Fe-2S) protein [Pyrinomonadaceae bacterium]